MRRLLLLITAIVFATGWTSSSSAGAGMSAQTVLRGISQPHVASRGPIVVVAGGRDDRIVVARSQDGGRTWSQPSVLPAGGTLALGHHRGPRVAIAGEAIVVSAIVGSGKRGVDGNLLAWRSVDGGRSWSDPVRVNDVADAAREGLHAMSAAGHRVVAAWIDLREPGATVRVALSQDGGVTWGGNRLAYRSPSGSVCPCCGPSVAIDDAGTVAVMFRNAIDGRRDLHVVRSTDAGASFGAAERLGVGSWSIDTCPMDGGSLVRGANGLVSVWRREDTLYLSRGSGDESRVGIGRDPAMAATPDGEWLAWSGPDGLMLLPAGSSSPALIDAAGRAAALAPAGDEAVVLAWERGDDVMVARHEGRGGARSEP